MAFWRLDRVKKLTIEEARKILKKADKYARIKNIRAIMMEEDFVIDTFQGEISGVAGDYLTQGIWGEIYPSNKCIFEENYKKIEK